MDETYVHVGTKFVFTKAQLITYCTEGAMLISTLPKSVGDKLVELVKTHSSSKIVVIDMHGINIIIDYALDNLFNYIKEYDINIIFQNSNQLQPRLSEINNSYSLNFYSESDNSNRDILSIGINNHNIKDMENEWALLKESFIKSQLKKSFEHYSNDKTELRRLHSTPILANGEFNSNNILSDRMTFAWLSFFMADIVRDILEENKLVNVKLLTASLRSAPFTAMIGMIADLEFETIDHFGPRHKVFDLGFIDRIKENFDYIYIGDFCVGGTEIKTAKTYTEMKFSRLHYAVVLGSLLKSKAFEDHFQLFYLYELGNLRDDIKFKLA